jgi:hypothetical protein
MICLIKTFLPTSIEPPNLVYLNGEYKVKDYVTETYMDKKFIIPIAEKRKRK